MDRSLPSDFFRACAGVLLGVLIGSAFVIVKPPDIYVPFEFIILGALVAGPILFVVLLLNYKRMRRDLAIVRTMGSLAGWFAFVALYLNEEFGQRVSASRSPAFVILVFLLTSLTLVSVGLAGTEGLWWLLHRLTAASGRRRS